MQRYMKSPRDGRGLFGCQLLMGRGHRGGPAPDAEGRGQRRLVVALAELRPRERCSLNNGKQAVISAHMWGRCPRTTLADQPASHIWGGTISVRVRNNGIRTSRTRGSIRKQMAGNRKGSRPYRGPKRYGKSQRHFRWLFELGVNCALRGQPPSSTANTS